MRWVVVGPSLVPPPSVQVAAGTAASTGADGAAAFEGTGDGGGRASCSEVDGRRDSDGGGEQADVVEEAEAW